MKRTLKVKGLNCSVCAEKISNKLTEVSWIDNVNINVAMGNVHIQTEADDEYSLPFIQTIVDSIEDGVILYDERETSNESFFKNKGLIKLLISVPLFTIGLLLSNYPMLKIIFLSLAYIVSGYEVLLRAFKNIIKGDFFDELFLMSIASIGAFIVGEVSEGVGVMIFFQLGEFFQDLAVGKSKKSIKSLMSIKPEFVRMENGDIVQPEAVLPGDIIEIRPGEKVPVDGILISKETTCDTKTITGESIPKTINYNDVILSGFVNISSVIKVKVSKTYSESTVSKILELVQNEVSSKTKTESFITKFSKIYTPIVVVTALIIAIFTPLLINGWTYNDSIYKALIFLVISCPCALVISVPLGYFGGLGRASKAGILIKGSIYLDELNKITKYAFDKTGTLTKGLFSVKDIESEIKHDDFLDALYKIEHKSNHPIAIAITTFTQILNTEEPLEYKEIPGKGIEATYGVDKYIGGNRDLLISRGVNIPQNSESYGTEVYISINSKYIGKIVLTDTLKPDVRNMVHTLGDKNVYMLTGDNEVSASYIAKKAGITQIKHSMLPSEKAEFIKALGVNEKVLFVGDGINDAPVLAASTVGISMGGLGSDAAIEASDIVIMTDEPSKVIEAVKISHFTKKIIIQNIVMALGFKLIIMILGLSGITGLWLAIFADVGVGLLAILNSIRTLNFKID